MRLSNRFERLESRRLMAASPLLSSVSLVRAPAGDVLADLTMSPTIDLATAGKISVQATGAAIGSVVFQLDGKTVQTESFAPYDIAGDTAAGPNPWTVGAGQHVLKAIPYSLLQAKGVAGTPITINLTVLPPTVTPPNTVTPVSPPVGSAKLNGALQGTAGSWQNKGNTIDKAVDGDANTYFDAPAGSVGSIGYDLGAVTSITQVQFVPRSGFTSRMVGGIFQGANSADFSDAVTLATVKYTPASGVFTALPVTDTTQYRYVRYLAPSGSAGNVAELEVRRNHLRRHDAATAAGVPDEDQLVNGKSSPTDRAEAVGGAVDGKVYVFGGLTNEGSTDHSIPLLARCDVYDPATNQWTRLGDMPEPFSHSEEVIVGTDMWFVGGYVGDHPGPGTTHVWVYHTTTDTWNRGPDLPVSRGAGAAALVGRTIYFAGGMDKTRTHDEDETFALDLDDQGDGWVQKADLPNGRNHVAGASLGGYFYVIGGQHGQEEAQSPQTEVDRYDPATDRWTTMASLPSYAGRSHITEATFAYEGRIVIVGGEDGYDNPQRTIVDYDPTTNAWSQLAIMPGVRSTAVTGIVGDKLIVATGNVPWATASVYVGKLS